MGIRLPQWLHRHPEGEKRQKRISLEDVVPEHPNEYPARHLKEILDGRRGEFASRASHPTGMPDGPGPLT